MFVVAVFGIMFGMLSILDVRFEGLQDLFLVAVVLRVSFQHVCGF